MKQTLSLILFVGLLATACKKNSKEAANAGDTDKAAVSMDGQAFTVDAGESIVTWVGSKPVGKHTGTVPVKSGSLKMKDGKIASGSFVLDFANLAVMDLAAGDGKEDLESHLKGMEAGKEDHFFNVAKYPTGKFEITKVANLESADAANVLVYGNLTIKDKTAPVSFKASVTKSGTGYMAKSDEFKIDRTKWGINFMSNSVFDNLKDKFINDEIGLTVNLKVN